MLGILGLEKPEQMTGNDLRIEDRGSRIEENEQ
jgi:hypothetical protein